MAQKKNCERPVVDKEKYMMCNISGQYVSGI